jgi:DNA-binding beta-propeller fold protein YncE
LYTTYYDTGALSVIDTGTNTQLTTAPISVKARDIISSPNGDKLYAVTGSDNRLVYINPISNSITTTIALPHPSGIAISNDNTKLYVSLYDNNLVTIIDIDTGSILTNI